MTKLNDMSDAPTDGTDILALTDAKESSYWVVVSYENSVFDDFEWKGNCGIEYRVSDLQGWLPLPEAVKT